MLRDRLDLPEKQDPRVGPVQQDLRDSLEKQDRLDLSARCRVRRDRRAFKASRVFREFKEKRVLLDRKDHRVLKVFRAFKAKSVRPVRKEFRDFKE
jgi:hypothetical protein